MIERKIQDSLSNLEKAMTHLEEALRIPRNQELVAEGTMQRFQVVVELLWKALKRSLEFEGLCSNTPRESLREAFRIGWLDNENAWLDVLSKRHQMSHAYLDEELINDSYDSIKTATPLLRHTVDFLKSRYSQ